MKLILPALIGIASLTASAQVYQSGKYKGSPRSSVTVTDTITDKYQSNGFCWLVLASGAKINVTAQSEYDRSTQGSIYSQKVFRIVTRKWRKSNG